MKNAFLILVLFILNLVFVSQAKAQSLSSKRAQIIENQIDSIFQHSVELAEKLDYDKLSMGVDDKYKAGFISNGNYYSEYATLIENIKSRAGGVGQQHITVKKKKITALSETIALLTASGVADATLSDGRVIHVSFYWSFVYEKIGANWKVIQSHQSGTR